MNEFIVSGVAVKRNDKFYLVAACSSLLIMLSFFLFLRLNQPGHIADFFAVVFVLVKLCLIAYLPVWLLLAFLAKKARLGAKAENVEDFSDAILAFLITSMLFAMFANMFYV